MLNRKAVAGLAVTLAALFIASCGSKDGDSKKKSRKKSTEVPSVTIKGQLSLTSNLALVSSSKKVLAFRLSQGRVDGAPEEIAVADDGTFSVSASSGADTMLEIEKALASDSLAEMKAHAVVALPGYAETINAISDISELRSGLASFKESSSKNPPTYVLISMDVSGDAVAEAQSFKFIGMPTSSGDNLLNIPTAALVGDVNLGLIAAGSDDEATAALAADTSVFSLSENAINEIATTSDALKILKNYWINKRVDGSLSANITPFFTWKVTDTASVENTFTVPTSAPLFTGTGMYLGISDIGATFDEVCPAAGSGQTALELFPPSDIYMEGVGSPFGLSVPLSNAGTLTRNSQYDGVACSASGTGGFYARNDQPDNGANSEMMVNWGSLLGTLPEGLWDLKFGSTKKASFDLASSYPVAENGHPKVYVPVFNVVTSGGVVTGLRVKFYIYSAAGYREADATVLEKNIHSLGFDVSSDGRDDFHIGDSTAGVTFTGGVFSYDFATDEQIQLSNLNALGFNYLIGNNSYRMDFRPAQ